MHHKLLEPKDILLPEHCLPGLDQLRRVERVVNVKPPFGGLTQVLAYHGCDTYRVASPLISLSDGGVRFGAIGTVISARVPIAR